ncbi:hypothetical protein [Tenacibaculum sp.]|uniref:hypothetical protein n=1 Tax=Tenacibaculum sp. TaxID=1906242 RepID=UPI003AA948D4
MKKVILLTLLTALACKKPIEKKYNNRSEFSDLTEINKKLTDYDSKVLRWQLSFIKSKSTNINKTYNEILLEGRKRWNDTLKKRDEIRKEEEEQIKKEKEKLRKKQIEPICNIKWGIYYNKPLHIKLNPKLPNKYKKIEKSIFSSNPKKNWMSFSENGFCEIKLEEERNRSLEKWELKDSIIIVYKFGGFIKKEPLFYLKIKKLNKNNFNVIKHIEGETISFLNEIKMKKMKK